MHSMAGKLPATICAKHGTPLTAAENHNAWKLMIITWIESETNKAMLTVIKSNDI
jgi:hypothetical protein